MTEKNMLLRNIPKVDELLREPALAEAGCSAGALTALVRQVTGELRQAILDGSLEELPERDELCARVLQRARQAALPSLRPVINATGITLHTNLGRACLSEAAAEAAGQAARNYSTLEYQLETGKRGTRYSHVENLLCKLTGAEAAVVVNNNAAAVLLVLTAMGKGGEVITSRGELVEIGGSFRIPEIMEQCGCTLREVGATNKTRLSDYRRAVGEQTRALLKVHTSNYRIVGFQESVTREELADLGREVGLPVIEDLGSGSLVDLNTLGIRDEPTIMDSVRAGIDVITFSGDKLLGGPQAGVIIGRRQWIEELRRHPLIRALRVDKMTLAALEATLHSYEDLPAAMEEIPTLRMLAARPEQLKKRAETLCNLLNKRWIPAIAVQEVDEVGGGSVPCQQLPTWCAAVEPVGKTVDQLERQLRRQDRPVIARIAHDRLLLDVRTIFPADLEAVAEAVERAMK